MLGAHRLTLAQSLSKQHMCVLGESLEDSAMYRNANSNGAGSIDSDRDRPAKASARYNNFADRVRNANAYRYQHQSTLRSRFRAQNLSDRAASVFDVLSWALPKTAQGNYFSSVQPTEADAVSAAYLSILLHPHLPDQSLGELLRTRYSQLIEHTIRLSAVLLSQA